ncbi:DNA-binding MarR family transcriptional regulator [Rhodococcus sp. 27YEA15]|uniref:MarR family winged helix-turn-helix transcriptional regulator n=1 Tax=Rhodococcus sp. 27YEA15 TaxID=3156259 RepID=UPI003C7E930F
MTDQLALDRQLCFALYSASRATTAAYRVLLDDMGITYPQYLVLLTLWEQDGRGVRDICDALHLDTGTLSPLLKRLDTLGLIERRRSSTDERRVDIHLTAAGSALRAKADCIPSALGTATGLQPEEAADLHRTLLRLGESLRDSIEHTTHHQGK